MATKLLTMLLCALLALFAGCLDDEDESVQGEVEVEGDGDDGDVAIDDEAVEDVDDVDVDCTRTDPNSGTCDVDVS